LHVPSSEAPSRRHPALWVGGVGAASAVVGLVFGGLAFAQWSKVSDSCRAGGSCNRSEVDHGQSAGTFANVSNATFVGAAVALTVAGVMWWTASSETQSKLSHVAIDLSGVTVRF